MGLVFYSSQKSGKIPTVHKYHNNHQTVIDGIAAHQSTRVNGKTVKQLSSENLNFLKSIGIFKKRNE